MRLLANQRGTPRRFPHDGHDEIHKKAVAGPGTALDKSRLLASCPDFGAGPLVWVCPGCPRREGLYLAVTCSERLGPEVSLGRSADCRLPEGKSKRARLGGLSAFWGWL
jgi:hypothetical protein